MSLRKQLLLVSLLTLALPFAGYQYIREMEAALRADHQESVADNARAIARVLAAQPQLLFDDPDSTTEMRLVQNEVYAQPLTAPVHLDGYPDDWGPAAARLRRYRSLRTSPTSSAESEPSFIDAATAADARHLYLFVRVRDNQVRYLDPSRGPHHDYLLLRTGDPVTGYRDLRIETSAPGPVQARVDGQSASGDGARARGVWQPTADGYQIELRIPRSQIGTRFGFAVVDGDDTPQDPPDYAGSVDPRAHAGAGRLIEPRAGLLEEIRNFAGAGRRLIIVDRMGWPLAIAGDSDAGADAGEERPGGLLARLYRWALDTDLPLFEEATTPGRVAPDPMRAALGGETDTRWYRRSDGNLALVAAAAPIIVNGGVVAVALLEQPSAAILTLTNTALTRLVNLTVLATFVAVVVLVGFATLLSLRIRRLRNAAEGALSSDGRVRASIPGTRARDEIGDLSRSFQSLLSQLRDHTDYLRSLAGKLSHELRTPLAVVQSSLENLEATGLAGDAATYARRATDGAGRLRYILVAMSEASRVEQSIEQSEKEPFDLAALLQGAAHGYQDTYGDRAFEYTGPDTGATLSGVPELIVQMLDKLIDNAVDFSPLGGVIAIDLSSTDGSYQIAVSNEGPPLPAAMRGRLFDSMVSLRDAKGARPHLGFGLFIARLIAEFHNGDIQADNLPAGGGVEFRIRLPKTVT